MSSYRLLAWCLLSSMLFGCSRGGPQLRHDRDDGQGPIIGDCENVSADYRVDEYRMDSYLTTGLSAFAEGAKAGIDEGVREADGPQATAALVGAGLSAVTGVDRFGSNSFCKVYKASRNDIVSALQPILLRLGNPIEISDPESGLFETDYLERRAPVGLSDTRMGRPLWRDRYRVLVFDLSEEYAGVKVSRDVSISRDETGFYKGSSVGHNEVWILTQISDALSYDGKQKYITDGNTNNNPIRNRIVHAMSGIKGIDGERNIDGENSPFTLKFWRVNYADDSFTGEIYFPKSKERLLVKGHVSDNVVRFSLIGHLQLSRIFKGGPLTAKGGTEMEFDRISGKRISGAWKIDTVGGEAWLTLP